MKFFKKALSLLFVLTMIGTLCVSFAVTSSAAVTADTAWPKRANGTTPAGTAADPYLIEDEADFLGFLAFSTGDAARYGKFIALTADLDLNGVAITQGATFRSTLDGQGHTISNLKLTTSGLFTNAGACTFKNLKFVNYSVTGTSPALFAPKALATCTINFENVSVQGTLSGSGDNCGWFAFPAGSGLTVNYVNCVDETTVTGSFAGGAGAFFGQSNGGSSFNFTNCVFKGDLSGATSSSWKTVGPFVGGLRANATLTNCVSIPKKTSTDASHASLIGIRGQNDGTVIIQDCYVSANAENAIRINIPASVTAVTSVSVKYGTTEVAKISGGTDLNNQASTANTAVVRRTYSADLSTYGYQFRQNTNTYDLRFIATVDFEDLDAYTEVGYEITVMKGDTVVLNAVKKGTDTVYSSILADSKTYMAKDLGSDYIYGAQISNFVNDATYTVIAVAYAKTADGTYVYGNNGMTVLKVLNGKIA